MSPDSAQLERFKRQVEEEWRNPAVAAAYRKWDRDEAEWGRAARDLVLDRAQLAPGLSVLDVASGHGEPGLAIAERVGATGHVTLTDISPDLLQIAAERAQSVGITNVTTQVADAHELPFADETFDRLTCRFAAMYFADYDMAFREALRVLKPGGMAVYLVWGGFDQPLFRDVFGTLFQYVQPPEDEPGAPSPFTFAQPGTLTQALEAAGFAQVSEDSTTIPTAFRGAPQRWWEWLVDMAPPFQPLVASLSDDDRQQALSEIYAVVGRYHDGSGVNVPIDVNIAWGSKPESR